MHLPIGFASDSMQILSALLAEIFIGTGFLVHDAHATTMLPHLTGVALDEHAPNVIRQRVRRLWRWLARLCLDGAATEGFATGGGQAWKFLLPTQTSSYFLLFIVFGVVFIFLSRRIIVIVASALARARVWDVGPRAVFGIVNRLRPWTGRALRRMVFLVGASAPIAGMRAGGTGGVGVLEEGRGGLCGASSRGAARRHGGDRSWRGM